MIPQELIKNLHQLKKQDQKEEVLKLSQKMLSLNFTAYFEKLVSGPILRTYYFLPHDSASFSKILNKEEELAGAIGTQNVLIRRELSHLAISIPRKNKQEINFHQLINQFMIDRDVRYDTGLPFLIGMTASGFQLNAYLDDESHLLIGGSTNSGKSMFLSQVVCSLALAKTPQQLQLTLVDTKQLDLVLFSELEHVRNVITNVDDFRIFLETTLATIRKRLAKMSGSARNIREWNAQRDSGKFPYIVVVIDELADILDQDAVMLNTVPRNQRPASIPYFLKQITQISRAAGVHLVAATQRPSVKVIAGDTKTNFPSRIAFRLPTMADSRVILDENGAERLLGQGDMLCKLATYSTSERVHSGYVDMKTILVISKQHQAIKDQFAYSEQMREKKYQLEEGDDICDYS